ncbi:hypothetical protein [Microcoleus sp. Pol12B4]|uniref:hypothetical protein n=1 Tax=Microcoleus sp. Pol12B4 TaxID=3055395 RepID=UPI002FD37CB3
MFSKIMDIWRFIAKLTRLMNKRLLRSLSSLIGLYILSIILSLPHAISASSQVEHNASITPLTIVQVAAMTLPSQIFRRWTHSREEDRADILVYRPKDYPFPPARGREGLEFRENGEFIRYQIGATDRSLAVPGRWSIQNTNMVEVQFPNQSVSSYTLTILECDEQILKVRQTAGGTSQ